MTNPLRSALREFLEEIENVRADFVAGVYDAVPQEYFEAELADDFSYEPGDLVTDEDCIGGAVEDFDWRWKWALRRLQERLP